MCPSLKEPVLSRVVSADCVAWARLCLCCRCGRSARSVGTDSGGMGRCLLGFASLLFAAIRCYSLLARVDLFPCCDLLREVSSVVLFNVRPCLYPSLRGRPRTVGCVRARARSGPTPIKSMRSSRGLLAAPESRLRRAERARSRGHIELAWSRRDSLARRRRINTVTRVDLFPPVMWYCRVRFHNLTRRIGQRWEPTPAPRQGSKRNGGGPGVHPFLCACAPFLFELQAINPSGARGTLPEKNTVFSPLSHAASPVPSNATNSWCFRIGVS
jgi:hypothetical protein